MSEDTGSTETALGREASTVDRIDLVVIGGPDAGRVMRATHARCVIGTAGGADLELSDPTVSRFHCEIVLEDGRATIHDLGAKNRTLVDGVAVIVAPLHDGAVLTLGNSTVRFAREPDALLQTLSPHERFGALVGRSRAMRAAFTMLEHAAASDTPILLRGETGTGKDLAAASVHQQSARRDGPFVVVDLAGVPAEQLASELFGQVAGADRDRLGAFERAHGGTVFLDEIGALDPDLQRQLLRVLDHRAVTRVGGTTPIPIDVRVIAATHRDLRADVNARRFRAELYFRIAALEIVIPSLRQRADDIPLLVSAIADELDDPPPLVRDPVWIAALLKHPWPGNVRELRNHVERAAIGAASGHTDVEQMPSLKVARERWVRMFESQYLAELLRAHGGNVTAAARTAGVDRVHLYRLLGRAGLK